MTYFPTVDADTGKLLSLRITPMCIRRMQAWRASRAEAGWLCDTVTRASERFGGRGARRVVGRRFPESLDLEAGAAWLRERTLELFERAKQRADNQ